MTLGWVKFRQGCCHFNLIHLFVGRVQFREGSGHSDLTHPFVGRAEVKFRKAFVDHAGGKFGEGCCHFNLTHPFVSYAGVKFREGCCCSKLKDVAISIYSTKHTTSAATLSEFKTKNRNNVIYKNKCKPTDGIDNGMGICFLYAKVLF